MVFLVLLESEGFYDMLNFHCEQVNHICFAHQGYDNFTLPYLDLHDIGLETHISDDSLCVWNDEKLYCHQKWRAYVGVQMAFL